MGAHEQGSVTVLPPEGGVVARSVGSRVKSRSVAITWADGVAGVGASGTSVARLVVRVVAAIVAAVRTVRRPCPE